MSSGFSHIAVFGPGLMGASLLMALRQKSPQTKLSVWARRDEAAREIASRGLAEVASTDSVEVLHGADTVVLCVPVDQMAVVASSIAPHAGADTLVTDVGSTKGKMTHSLEQIFSSHRNFVGSHPMCGSEESGLEAARPDLYQGALCVVCPTKSSRKDLVDRAEKLWQMIGARTAILSPEAHDAATATASHVPHVAAAALVELAAQESDEFRKLCASGFRDTTRIAAGSPTLWSAILGGNAEQTAEGLARLEGILKGYREALLRGDRAEIERRLAAAAKNRAKIFPNT
jgi:prephenate dehydrogenase